MTVLRVRLQVRLLLLLAFGASMSAAIRASASNSRVKRQQLEVVNIPDNPGGSTPSPVTPTFTASPPSTQAPSGGGGGRGLFGSGFQFPSLFDGAGFGGGGGGGFEGGAFGGFGRGGANGNNNNNNNGNANGNSGFGFNPFGGDGASNPFGNGGGSPFGNGRGRGSPFANGGGFPGGFSGGFPGIGNTDDDIYDPFNSNNVPNTNPGNNIPGNGSNGTNNSNNNNNPFDVFPGYNNNNNNNNNNNGFGPGRPFDFNTPPFGGRPGNGAGNGFPSFPTRGPPGNGAGNGFPSFPTRGPPGNGAGNGFQSFPTRGPPAFPLPGTNRPTLALGSNVCTPPVFTPLGDRVANTTVPEEVKSAIAQELSRNAQLSQYLQYAAQIRGASVSAPSTEGSDVDCPSTASRATVFERYGSSCWILQDNQEPFYYATCNCNQCLAPAGSAQAPGSACEPYLQPTALFAYCQNSQDPSHQITRERVALPVTCRCRHAAPANVQAAPLFPSPSAAAPVTATTTGPGFGGGPGQIGAPVVLGDVTSGPGAVPVVFTK